eukprot:3244424-Amphidinium_carterae.2
MIDFRMCAHTHCTPHVQARRQSCPPCNWRTEAASLPTTQGSNCCNPSVWGRRKHKRSFLRVRSFALVFERFSAHCDQFGVFE